MKNVYILVYNKTYFNLVVKLTLILNFRCKQWVKMVGKEDLAYLQVHMLHDLKHVCEAHFSRRDFTKSKKRLKKRAVPKLNLTLPPLRDEILLQFLQLNSQGNWVHIFHFVHFLQD